jgi:hypothetical protein
MLRVRDTEVDEDRAAVAQNLHVACPLLQALLATH